MPNRYWLDVPISIDFTVLLGAPVLYLQGEEGAGSDIRGRFNQADTINIVVVHHLIYFFPYIWF